MMRYDRFDIVRLSGRPPEPERPRRQAHPPATHDKIRTLVLETTLTYREIAKRTGVSAATVSRRVQANRWLRPVTGMPEEHYTPEGRRKLRRSAIAEALLRQAEHLLFTVEMNPNAKRTSLREVMRLVRAARQLDAEESPKKPKQRRSRVLRAWSEPKPPKRWRRTYPSSKQASERAKFQAKRRGEAPATADGGSG